jgi:hypothetical protein
VKNRFQNLPFKFNLQRYNAASLEAREKKYGRAKSLKSQAAVTADMVGLYKLNSPYP